MSYIGKHCMITIRNIKNAESLKYIDTVKPILDEIVKVCNLHVVSESGHQFEPFGVTYVYVLSESHMSIHTYPENASAYMDIFCCNLSLNTDAAIDSIKKLFNTTNVECEVFLR